MITEWYVFKWCELATRKMYVILPFFTLDSAITYIVKMETNDLAERLRRFQLIRSSVEKQVLLCTDDREISEWILCHYSMLESLIKTMKDRKIQVVNRCQ